MRTKLVMADERGIIHQIDVETGKFIRDAYFREFPTLAEMARLWAVQMLPDTKLKEVLYGHDEDIFKS